MNEKFVKRICESLINETRNQTKTKTAVVKEEVKKEAVVELKCSKCEKVKQKSPEEEQNTIISNELKYLLYMPNSNNSLEVFENSYKPCHFKTIYGNDQLSLNSEILHNYYKVI